MSVGVKYLVLLFLFYPNCDKCNW